MDTSSGSNPLQQLASQTEINPRELNIPHKPHHFVTPKVILLAVTFLILASSATGATIFLFKKAPADQTITKEDTQSTSPSPAVSPVPTSDPIASWIPYKGSIFSFRYNPSWKIVQQNTEPREYILLQINETDYISVYVATEEDIKLAQEISQQLSSNSAVLTPPRNTDQLQDLQKDIIDEKIQVDGKTAHKTQIKSGNLTNVVLTGTPSLMIVFNGKVANNESTVSNFLSTISFFPGEKDNISNPFPGEAVFCTQDAKACPDGSFVGRTGPNCEFAACP